MIPFAATISSLSFIHARILRFFSAEISQAWAGASSGVPRKETVCTSSFSKLPCSMSPVAIKYVGREAGSVCSASVCAGSSCTGAVCTNSVCSCLSSGRGALFEPKAKPITSPSIRIAAAPAGISHFGRERLLPLRSVLPGTSAAFCRSREMAAVPGRTGRSVGKSS